VTKTRAKYVGITAALLVITFFISGCISPSVELESMPRNAVLPPPGELALDFVAHINDNLYSRTPFTVRERETALWIESQLRDMGYDDSSIEIQKFSFQDVTHVPMTQWIDPLSLTPEDGELTDDLVSQNVILRVAGAAESPRTIVIGAHYDTHYANGGASDNASGVALLLESAYRMQHQQSYHNLVYVFFGAEEVGLLGAEFFRSQLDAEEIGNLLFMINADVLLDGEVLGFGVGYQSTGSHNIAAGHRLAADITSIAQSLSQENEFKLQALADLIRVPTDHQVFLAAGDTVVNMAGLSLMEVPPELQNLVPTGTVPMGFMVDGVPIRVWGEFEGKAIVCRVCNSPRDTLEHIETNWPGLVAVNMNAFGTFLEALILTRW
jgi:hypothetical protein